jgi:tetratricopeptide (TPR) repeat protein
MLYLTVLPPDELLAAVRARVNRYVNSGDTEDILDQAGVRDARALLAVIDETGYPRGEDALPWIHAYHAAGLLHHARNVARPDTVDREQAESLLAQVHDWVPDLAEQLRKLAQVPQEPARLRPRRIAVHAFAGSALDEIDGVVTATRHAIRECRDWSESLTLRMNLAEAQHLRFGRTGDVADLSEAITTAQAVIRETAPYDARYTNRLSTLAGFLQARFVSTMDISDLDAAVESYRKALDAAAADHEDRPMYLSNLGRARLLRYAYVSQDPAELDTALAEMRTAVDTTTPDDPGLGTRLSGLHQAYRARYEATRDAGDLAEALRTAHAAVEATAPEHMDYLERILDVGATHLERYERGGDEGDATAATEIARSILHAVPPEHPLHRLATDVLDRAGGRTPRA